MGRHCARAAKIRERKAGFHHHVRVDPPSTGRHAKPGPTLQNYYVWSTLVRIYPHPGVPRDAILTFTPPSGGLNAIPSLL